MLNRFQVRTFQQPKWPLAFEGRVNETHPDSKIKKRLYFFAFLAGFALLFTAGFSLPTTEAAPPDLIDLSVAEQDVGSIVGRSVGPMFARNMPNFRYIRASYMPTRRLGTLHQRTHRNIQLGALHKLRLNGFAGFPEVFSGWAEVDQDMI